MLRLVSTLECVHLALAYRGPSRSANLFSIGGWEDCGILFLGNLACLLALQQSAGFAIAEHYQ
jgi:hypothetical protein